MRTLAALFGLLLVAGNVPARGADDADGVAFFESRIRPVLVEQCYSCHSHQAKKLKAELYMDSREALLKGGESGPAIVPGDPARSRMIEAVSYKNVDLVMPPKDKLPAAQIRDLERWVKIGAPWPKGDATKIAARDVFDVKKRAAEHWCWQPVKAHAPPAVNDVAWARDPLDRFVLAKLEEKRLRPAAEADRRAWLRRVTFDLTGLPPKVEEVRTFLADQSEQAHAKVVDRLLASPAYGERWGRHWLDLVRYAETLGHEFDYSIQNAWRYRDYVIRAVNEDVPYDRFLVEHVAGDLLNGAATERRSDAATKGEGGEQPVSNPQPEIRNPALATGFFFLGEGTHSPVDVRLNQAETIDNRLDVLGKAFLGLTIACARCHDHKFDAISTADYYALFGYAKSTRYTQAATNADAIAKAAKELDAARDALRRAVASAWLAKADAVAAALTEAAKDPKESRELVEHRVMVPEAAKASAFDLGGWFVEGETFAPARAGDAVVGDAKRAIVQVIETPATFDGRARSVRIEGAVRSPTFVIDKPFLNVLAAGQGARINVVVDNFGIIRNPIYGGLRRPIKSDGPTWMAFDLSMWRGHQAYIEVVDKTVGDLGTDGSPRDAWAAVYAVTADDGARKLDRESLSFVSFRRDPKGEPQASPEASAVAAENVRKTIDAFSDGTLSSLPDAGRRAALLNWAIAKGLLDVADERTTQALARLKAAEANVPAPVYAPAAIDGNGVDEHVMIRGNPRNVGPTVPRRFLEALTSGGVVTSGDHAIKGSGRLDLARRIASRDNPLTARVMVNRVWHHLFGRGIVASVDNFGVLGETPSHPELLDYLAARFADEGWSVKKLIRALVLSSTYRQSSRSADPAYDEADPSNILLHRAGVRRLEAESIRDSLLAISGRLDSTMGGPSVPVHLTAFMDGRGRPGNSGPMDGAGRRSVYQEVRRNFLPPMLLAFDMPQPLGTMGRRSVTNVPAQALILMNDPFVQEQAKLWAKRVIAGEKDAPARVARMYEEAYGRPATAEEVGPIMAFVEQSAKDGRDDLATWADVAHVLINAKEFVFVE
ncbi:MAG TPA: PSD1 and planctomycete cytochrome C domain-containing protein [Tepidisphaeraceae bacterium]|nr:PSD1 and planctomycete cytochrome C domain-containing protein [Tepidisphaeraceae bacterium]